MTDGPSFRAKVRSGVIWSLVQNWGLRLGSLLVFMLLARILSPRDMGLFAAASTVVAFCALFVESGLGEAVVQRAQVTPQQLNSIFVINIALALVAVAGLWLAADWISAYMKLPELTWILRIGSLGVLISAVCFGQNAMYRRRFEYRVLAVASLIATVVSGALAIAMALAGWGAWSLVAQALSSALIIAVVLWWRPQWTLSADFNFRGTAQLLSYGGQRLLTTLLDFANTRFIELFFASTLGASALGLYVVGTRIYQALMQILCSAVLDIAHNAFSRLTHDMEKLRNAYYAAMVVSAAIAVPAFCIPAALAPEIVDVVFGTKWSGAELVLQPMLLLGAVQVLQFYNGIVYNALGRPGIGLIFMLGKTVVTMSALYLARSFSIENVVLTFVACQLLITPASFFVAIRVIGISILDVIRRTAPFLSGSGVAYLSIELARPLLSDDVSQILRLASLSILGSFTYGLWLFLFARRQAGAVIATFRHSRKKN